MKYVLALLVIGINFIVHAQATEQGAARNENCRVDLRMMERLQQKCFWSSGIVRRIDQENGIATIFHNAIPALGWPSMTMPFTVYDRSLLNRIKVGENAEFEFVIEEKNSVIVGIK